MKKNYVLIFLVFLCFVWSGSGQTKLGELTFETPGGYTTSVAEFSDGGTDYFTRTDGSNIGGAVNLLNLQGSFYFAAQDTDADNGNPANLTLNFNNVNISGYSSLELRIHLAEDDDGTDQDWDASSYMHITGSIDSGTSQNILWVEAAGGTNTEPRIDTNFNGTGNGTAITDTFTQFTANISGTGADLDIEIEFNNLRNGDEDIAIDSIEIWGTSSCTPPADPLGTISGTTPACNSTTLTYTGATIPGTVDYWQTTPTGTSTANNATGTFNATATGTYYVRKFLTATSCWSTGAESYSVVINNAPIISGQPTNATRAIPAGATFSVTASGSPAPTYQWQLNTGSGWNPIPGATSNNYSTGATSAAMNGNQYRCVVTNTCGTINSNAAILTLTNTPPNNVTGVRGCFEDNSVTIDWNPPATVPAPTGYMIFALDGGTDPAGAKTDANTYTANSDFSAATPVTPASLGRVVYKGAATSAAITGLIEDNNYSFTVYSYVGEALTGWSGGGTGGSTVTNETAQGDVSNLVATPLTNQVNLNWNNPLPTSCFDQLIIVANEGPVVFTPSGTYPNSDVNYTTPNSIVYSTNGTVSVNAVNGLTNGTSYCFKVFIRRGLNWSEGVEVCAVPLLTYCASAGNGSDGFFTLVNNVEFNTIDNPSNNDDNAYTDFTSISTTVTLGDTYNLDVRVNTDGLYTTITRAWIDWNNDGDFNDSNENYELGFAYNAVDGSTDASPLAIEIPTNAASAVTRMRITTQYYDSGFPTDLPTPCKTNFDGEVEDYTINIVQPVNAEMNIKGNNISIANGFNAPFGLNNTLFGAQNVGSTSAFKSYFVENIGATNLTLTGTPRVTLIGAHPGDFNVILQPAASIGSLSDSEFRIVFSPTADGTRTATVRIENTDSDEDPYEFDIQGNAVCSTVLTSALWPTEGPENTEVTITSANDLTGATATINGVTMFTVSNNATELVVLVPAGATSGNLEVLYSTGCSSTNTFTVLDDMIGGCETAASSTVPSDLFISEISDATSGSSSLIEIFNGTSGTINLSGYSIRIFNNGSTTPSTTANLIGSLAPGGVHVISVGTTLCDLTGNGLNGSLPDQTFNSAGGINFDNNSSDAIQLFNGGSPIDTFGVVGGPTGATWANGLVTGGDGVNFRRQNTATPLPSTTFDIAQWDQIDWTSCGDSDYSDFGQYDFSLGVPPLVTVLNAPTFECTSAIQLSIMGSEGVPGGLGLTYQWYYLVPTTNTFVAVPSNPDFNNDSTSASLDIINPIPYLDYQFYCQVRENTNTCYVASNAVKLEADVAIWSSSSWSMTPSSSSIVIINDDYDTGNGAVPNGEISFEACQLVINAGHELIIRNGDYIVVENNLTVNGSIIVESEGSFVQVDDMAVVDGDVLTTKSKISVEKETAFLASYQEYTYWSSPVFGEILDDGLAEASSTRRFWYNAQNYLDSQAEVGNNDATTPGQDDIDDNGDDWQFAAGTDPMLPGVGYASTHKSLLFINPSRYKYIFEGPFNNGVISVPIYRNDSQTLDNNWNFIGNPYPSALDADLFLAGNTVIDQNAGTAAINGAIFFWSHNTAANASTNGNEVLNYAQSDYAIINGSGQIAGGDGLTPTRHIPSGQGFFVSMDNGSASTLVGGSIRTTDVVFNNSMRVIGNNNQFFRLSNSSAPNKVWLNLNSDNGVFNQVLVAYVDGATNGDDGMYYDAHKNLSANANSVIYSFIESSENKKFAIQGKEPNSLTLDEVIPLGFYTSIDEATLFTLSIAQLEGEFMNDNTIYVKDNFMNITHNLSSSDYTFTSETGEFNDRFEIVFQSESLSVIENEISPNGLSITELGDGSVKFSVGNGLMIKHVDIIDTLGRTIYKLNANSNVEVFDLTRLSQAAYIARVTLSNGQTITKKAVKTK